MSGPTPRRLWFAMGAVCLFAAGLSIGARGPAPADVAPTPPHAVRNPESSTEAPSGPGPAVSRSAVSARDRAGAVEAATGMVVAFDGPDLLDETARRALLDQHASQRARGQLEGVLGEVGSLISERLSLDADDFADAGFVWRTVPAGWRLTEFSPEHAAVDVWSTGLVVAHGLPLTQPSWRTTRVDLVWERDAWRLRGFESQAGPQPPTVGGTTAAASQARRINTFHVFRHTPAEVNESTP